MATRTVTHTRRLGPAVSVLVPVALLLVGLGALLWNSIPDQLYLTLRGEAHIVEQVLPRAQAGDPEAQYDLASRYAGGRGVPKNPRRAAKWYRAAAEADYARAQSSLGLAYYWGTGVQQNYAKAAEWLRRAGEQNMAGSQYMLGLMHESGKGVPKDLPQAALWHRRAAQRGNLYAQQRLAMLARDGRGVPMDKIEAYKWLELAIPQLNSSPARESWIKMQAQIGTAMTHEGIARARRLAQDWRPTSP